MEGEKALRAAWIRVPGRSIWGLAILLIYLFQPFAYRAAIAQEGDLATVPVTNLSNSPDIVSRYADITADCAGRVHVVWVEQDAEEDGVSYLTYSHWDGNAWTPPNDIAVAAEVLIPSIVADSDGNLHVMYVNGAAIMHTRTTGGPSWSARSWSEAVAVGAQEVGGHHRWHDLFVDEEDDLHLLYQNWGAEGTSSFYTEMYHTRSSDGGQSWSKPMLLSNRGQWAQISGTSNFLTMDEEGVLYALWGEGRSSAADYTSLEVWLARSPDGGNSWLAPVLMSDPAVQPSEPVAIISDGRGTLHLLWHRGAKEINHQRSLDQGQTWTEPVVVFTAEEGMTRYGKASTGVDGRGGVHVVLPLDNYNLYYLRWTGDRWLPAVNLTSDWIRQAYWPRLAIANGNMLHLVWNHGHSELGLPDLQQRLARGEYEILHKEIRLDAPQVDPAACRIGQARSVSSAAAPGDDTAATVPPPGSGGVEPTRSARQPRPDGATELPTSATVTVTTVPVRALAAPAVAHRVPVVVLGIVASCALVVAVVLVRVLRLR